MEGMPYEIIREFVSYLDSRSLLNLALTSSHFNHACLSEASRHLCVLNTLSALSGLAHHIKQTSPLTRALTVYHGEWPKCDYKAWQLHPLQVYEAHPFVSQSPSKKEKALQAFPRYRHFVADEGSRSRHGDIRRLNQILSSLPQLERITISHACSHARKPKKNVQLTRLCQQIWLSPCRRNAVDRLASDILTVLPNYARIQDVKIEGTLNLESIAPLHAALGSVTKLDIQSMNMANTTPAMFQSFFSLFPALQDLQMNFCRHNGLTVIPLDHLDCPNLRSVYLANLPVVLSASKWSLPPNQPPCSVAPYVPPDKPHADARQAGEMLVEPRQLSADDQSTPLQTIYRTRIRLDGAAYMVRFGASPKQTAFCFAHSSAPNLDTMASSQISIALGPTTSLSGISVGAQIAKQVMDPSGCRVNP
ncbi:predicted protein [Verticillium alfalfae VaMs.102]|uniref:Predicted protein n=1 Tax=Verticillium alfalfae (strain VaMs.102 / ATCC MYA-4576 / FGSC 10136) TaxID=526221 RepID=C9SZ44_VERA1|nr:predicted protein [Verticillium alfalfae VaMs.102]EEY24059.1 predicted protein [Verticillium alfalfae VaMs.102]KAH6699430.1 hypothetical protein EV126DRAFT_460923 [Verticillium dahliae]KAH6699647.1 hypothetical protein EV126DRAFT_386941 [Verticillium dahliae]